MVVDDLHNTFGSVAVYLTEDADTQVDIPVRAAEEQDSTITAEDASTTGIGCVCVYVRMPTVCEVYLCACAYVCVRVSSSSTL